MEVSMHTTDYAGSNVASARTRHQRNYSSEPDVAVITFTHQDGSAITLFGPGDAWEAFDIMADAFNLALNPKPKESEHLGTVALDEPTNT